MTDTMSPRYRLFEVEVAGFPPATYSALSRSKALYQCYLRFSEPWPCSFREFLAKTKCRATTMPADDGYGYVRRTYGVDPRIGQRCRLKNEGPSTGLEGEVVYPGKSTAHVHVVIDGRDFAVNVHPMNIELLGNAA